MGDLEKVVVVGGGGAAAAAQAEEEEEERLLEGMAVLDFDMLCSTVAMQTELVNWKNLETHAATAAAAATGGSGGVFRMWEGEVLDCFEDRRIAIESLCCPCYRFGKNIRRAGFGYCFLQGSAYGILALGVLLNFIAYTVTKQHCFL